MIHPLHAPRPQFRRMESSLPADGDCRRNQEAKTDGSAGAEDSAGGASGSTAGWALTGASAATGESACTGGLAATGVSALTGAWTVIGTGSSRARSHSQQSLHRRHFGQRWLSQASFVQRAQICIEDSPQILQINGMQNYFFLPAACPEVLAAAGGSVATMLRQRCASRSITAHSCSRCEERFTI